AHTPQKFCRLAGAGHHAATDSRHLPLGTVTGIPDRSPAGQRAGDFSQRLRHPIPDLDGPERQPGSSAVVRLTIGIAHANRHMASAAASWAAPRRPLPGRIGDHGASGGTANAEPHTTGRRKLRSEREIATGWMWAYRV